VKVWDGAEEAVAVWSNGAGERQDRECASCQGSGWWIDPAADDPEWVRCPACNGLGDEVDEVRSASEAGRRARAAIRRYAVHNNLSRLCTLTWQGGGVHDFDDLAATVARFILALRRRMGGRDLGYLWVPELHKRCQNCGYGSFEECTCGNYTTHGYHVHIALGSFIPKDTIAEAWLVANNGKKSVCEAGFVDVRLLRTRLGNPLKGKKAARQAARYLSKYVGKATDRTVPKGRHRYDKARGEQFRPVPVEFVAGSEAEVRIRLLDFFDQGVTVVWSSALLDEGVWRGPPVVMFRPK
jgi:hypothetical protein